MIDLNKIDVFLKQGNTGTKSLGIQEFYSSRLQEVSNLRITRKLGIQKSKDIQGPQDIEEYPGIQEFNNSGKQKSGDPEIQESRNFRIW